MRRYVFALPVLLAMCSRDRPPAEPERAPSTVVPVVSVPQVDASPAEIETVVDAGSDGAVVCVVAIDRLIEAAIYRGPGVDSPARQKTIESLPPDKQRRWAGRDHSVKHLACTYSVSVNGTRYRHRHNGGQDFGADELDTATCSSDAMRREVEKSIRDFTKECRDLHAGEYWGYRLEPLP
jgi:hypothetical protein